MRSTETLSNEKGDLQMKQKYKVILKNLTINIDFSNWFWKKQTVQSFLLERLTEISNLFYKALGFLLGIWLYTYMVAKEPASLFILIITIVWFMFDVRFDFHIKEKEALP